MKTFGNVNKKDPGNFEAQQRWKKEQLISVFDQLIAAGFNYTIPTETELHNFDIDQVSANTLNGFVTSINAGEFNPHEGYIRSSDDINIVMDDSQVKAFGRKAGRYRSKLIRRTHQLKDDIRDATTVEELDAINLNAGWPAN